MSDPSPDTPNAYAPRCGHHGNPLVWLDPCWLWSFPGRPHQIVTALADELRNAIPDIDAHATPFGTGIR